jgi:glycosyltransferase involved in cell wall biosynthesis
MKILHVITTLDVGGAEMHLLSQVRGQCARGHTVRVAYLKGFGKLAQEFRDAGAEQAAPLGGLLRGFLRLRRELAWADIVHSHLLKADVFTAGCAALFGRRAKLVSGKHNDEQVLKKPWVSRVHGFFGNLPARTIVLSDHVGRFIEQHGRVRPERVRRVYYGIDPERFAQPMKSTHSKRGSLSSCNAPRSACAPSARTSRSWRRAKGASP